MLEILSIILSIICGFLVAFLALAYSKIRHLEVRLNCQDQEIAKHKAKQAASDEEIHRLRSQVEHWMRVNLSAGLGYSQVTTTPSGILRPGDEFRRDLALGDLIGTFFSKEELERLTLFMGFNFDDIPGEIVSDKATELVGRVRRLGLVGELIKALSEERPNVDWVY